MGVKKREVVKGKAHQILLSVKHINFSFSLFFNSPLLWEGEWGEVLCDQSELLDSN